MELQNLEGRQLKRSACEWYLNLILGILLTSALGGCEHFEDSGNPENEVMPFIPAAGKTFLQGRTNSGWMKHRKATLTRNYRMDRHEVTRKDYAERMGLPRPPEDSLRMPMTKVDWYDAILYCNRRSRASRLDSVYAYSGDTTICTYQSNGKCLDSASIPKNIEIDLDRTGFRLPTLAEWEFACIGGKSTLFYWGDGDGDYVQYEWAKEGATSTVRAPMHPIGLKRPNPYGLFDIMGNAAEWANDSEHDPADSLAAIDPLKYTPNDTYHMSAGVTGPSNSLKYSSFSATPATGRLWSDVGFRCVRTIKE